MFRGDDTYGILVMTMAGVSWCISRCASLGMHLVLIIGEDREALLVVGAMVSLS